MQKSVNWAKLSITVATLAADSGVAAAVVLTVLAAVFDTDAEIVGMRARTALAPLERMAARETTLPEYNGVFTVSVVVKAARAVFALPPCIVRRVAAI